MFRLLRAREGRGEIFAGQILHADEVVALNFPELVGRDDVRVLEPRGDTRLVEKHLSQLLAVGEMRKDSFERNCLDEAFDPAALRQIQTPHATLPEQCEQSIATKTFFRTV